MDYFMTCIMYSNQCCQVKYPPWQRHDQFFDGWWHRTRIWSRSVCRIFDFPAWSATGNTDSNYGCLPPMASSKTLKKMKSASM